MTVHRSRRAVLAAGLVLGGAGIAACISNQHGLAKPDALRSLSGVTITPRKAWGAAPPDLNARVERGLFDPMLNRGGWREYGQPLDQILRTLVVHHSALPAFAGPRDIQRLHQGERGFADIGYHYVIDRRGEIYEGRPIGVRGAHTGGFNTGTVGVCLMGHFERESPSQKQMAALQSLAGALRDAFGATHLTGHRDFQPGVTVCPGANLAPSLPALAVKARLLFGTDGYRGV